LQTLLLFQTAKIENLFSFSTNVFTIACDDALKGTKKKIKDLFSFLPNVLEFDYDHTIKSKKENEIII